MRRAAAFVLFGFAACAHQDDIVTPSVLDAGANAPVDAATPLEAGVPCVGIECAKIKLAFRRIFIGDTDRGERPLPHAWRSFGSNIDGLFSSYTRTNECGPPDGGSPYPPIDGDDGIDNQWGQSIVPLLKRWDAAPTKAQNELVMGGGRTPLVVLGALAGGLNESKLEASFSFVETTTVKPAWDGSDVRTLAAAWAPAFTYRSATFANGTFDSGPADATIPIELTLGAQSITLPVRGLRVRFELRPDGSAIGGVLSGAVSVADLTTSLKMHVPECGRIAEITTTILQAADVLADGKQDNARACDAVSFGVGFDAEPVEVRGVAPPVAAPSAPCP